MLHLNLDSHISLLAVVTTRDLRFGLQFGGTKLKHIVTGDPIVESARRSGIGRELLLFQSNRNEFFW